MDLGLNMEYLPMELVYRSIKETDPLHGLRVNEKNILGYLKRVNGMLVKPEVTLEELQSNYITAASIYAFVHPVLGLGLDEVKEKFMQILRKGPYDESKPLDLYFQRAGEESQKRFLEIHKSNIEEEVSFKKSKSLGKRVNEEITILIGQLRKKYFERGHFSFTSYNDVCTPLFNLEERDDAGELDIYLREKFGTFLINIPECFR